MKRTPEEHRARRLVRARTGDDQDLCETCLTEVGTDWSHRKRRSQGGLWCPSNGLWQGRTCHRLTDSGSAQAEHYGWHLRRHQDPLTTPVYLARHGWVLLDPNGGMTPCAPPLEESA